MMKMSKGGVVLTGVGAFLILSKGLTLIDRTVNKLTDAIKWRAYYKAFRKTGRADMVQPDYKDIQKEETKESASMVAAKDAVADAITKAINNLFKDQKGSEGAVEGQEKASETIYDRYFKDAKSTDEINAVKDFATDVDIFKDAPETPSETAEDQNDIPTIHVVKDEEE